MLFQVYKVLNKIAGHITDWDDIETFGLELDVELNTILQAKSDERTIKGATFKVLHTFWDKTVKSDKEKWKIVKDALNHIGKKTAIKTTGVDQLCTGERKKLSVEKRDKQFCKLLYASGLGSLEIGPLMDTPTAGGGPPNYQTIKRTQLKTLHTN